MLNPGLGLGGIASIHVGISPSPAEKLGLKWVAVV